MEEFCWRAHFLSWSLLLSHTAQAYTLRLGATHSVLVLPTSVIHQDIPHRHAHRLIWWKQLLGWGSLSSEDTQVVNKNQPVYWPFREDAGSVYRGMQALSRSDLAALKTSLQEGIPDVSWPHVSHFTSLCFLGSFSSSWKETLETN